ncbi:Uncharacterized protein Rs2_00315 [Raphanus sativus]|uniref:Uncharacterized protein LOC130495125 n=1 Tax=Raphanus sativus TaxID=3726 RepID=A0A9W3BSM7_RAPSA|nr:uncharacterized protein LOC130495125 [Raphanus sativus]KAJ4914765.1 Uncharacterized protein Rs2_00315 [Raphanus sativus]
MNKGSSPKCQDKSKEMEKPKKLKEDSAKETVEHKQVPESENPKTDAKEEKESDGTSDKKDKKEKKSCCKKCKAKAKLMKQKLKEESNEEDEKQKQKTEKANEEKGSKVTSDVKAEKEKSIIAWRHKSTKKDKSHGKNSFSVNPPCQTARSMYHGGPNFSNPWNMYAPPRVMYPAFAKGPMYGQCGGGGGPFQQPYQPMNPAAMYRGAIMSPYPPMAAAAAMYPPPYWQSRPYTDANPITRYTTYRDNYTTYRDNYSYFFI